MLGGKLTMQTYGEANVAKDPADANRIIHAWLKSDGISLMASDSQSAMPVTFGDNVHLSLIGSDQEKLTDCFTKLAEGGKITAQLEKQFWGDTYGMLTDKFGVHWMVNITQTK